MRLTDWLEPLMDVTVSQWKDLAASVLPSAVAIVSVVVSGRVTRVTHRTTLAVAEKSQETALAVAKIQADGQRTLAQDARNQARAQEAYEPLQKVLTEYARWAAGLNPFWTSDSRELPPVVAPDMPDLVEGHWSPRVDELMRKWRMARMALIVTADQERERRLSELAGSPDVAEQPLDAGLDVQLRVHNLSHAASRLKAQIRAELRGDDDGAVPVNAADDQSQSSD